VLQLLLSKTPDHFVPLHGWIPAGAGETARPCRRRSTARVDPRGGGGDDQADAGTYAAWGGSPRGRGRRGFRSRRARGRGWIPAGAGETLQSPRYRSVAGVDPRGGGGDSWQYWAGVAFAGGSPRGRGRRGTPRPRCGDDGWIPAGAGETEPPPRSRDRARVDPRGGGGDSLSTSEAVPARGGSPRGRGRPSIVLVDDPGGGWIPAGAGETPRQTGSSHRQRVDPRGGGGDMRVGGSYTRTPGGSPRGRGRLAERSGRRDPPGWIPAGAGETASHASRNVDCRVDPRGGGGDRHMGVLKRPEKGGSPRGRGRPTHGGIEAAGEGWIPAGAGETRARLWSGPSDRVDPRGGGGD